jgi:hypothetical protein
MGCPGLDQVRGDALTRLRVNLPRLPRLEVLLELDPGDLVENMIFAQVTCNIRAMFTLYLFLENRREIIVTVL